MIRPDTPTRSWALTGMLAAAAMLAACERQAQHAPTAPAPPADTRTAARIELTGPDTAYIGKPVQYTVTAVFEDGSSADATREATWTIDAARLTMSAPGLMTAWTKGDTRIDVRFGGRHADISRVIAVPEGTFRLHGSVRDQFTGVDAVVRIDDPSLGQVEMAAPFGEFVVWGVGRGETRITAIKDGYQAQTQVMTLTGHQHVFFELALAGARAQLAGRYTLTVTAAPECQSMPESIRRRSYAADVEQSGADLTVRLTGPEFRPNLNVFRGFVEAGLARLSAAAVYEPDPLAYSPSILEILPDDLLYSFDGRAILPLDGDVLAGRLDGGVGSFNASTYSPVSRCRSINHAFVLSR